MDKFKLINDAHGHTGGNIALEHLAGTISSSLRAGDTVGRWDARNFLQSWLMRIRRRRRAWGNDAGCWYETPHDMSEKSAFRPCDRDLQDDELGVIRQLDDAGFARASLLARGHS